MHRRILKLFIGLLLIGISGCESDDLKRAAGRGSGGISETSTAQSVVQSEEAILTLTPRLKLLNASAMNLQVPFGKSAELFAEQVEVKGIGGLELSPQTVWPAEKRSVAIAESRQIGRTQLKLWPEFFGHVTSLNSARFYLVDGSFEGDEGFEATVGFDCAGRLDSGLHFSASAKSKVRWVADSVPTDFSNVDRWMVNRWTTISFDIVLVDKPLFSERMAGSIVDFDVVSGLSRSQHDLTTVKLIRNPEIKPDGPYPFHFAETHFEHPSIAVTDLERDGLDDFYLTGRYVPNRFFRNLGDGTFQECGSELGLDIEGGSSAVVFFDFDNDGDKDAFVGRARERAILLTNENGKFVDRTSECFAFESPFLVSSAAVADYDGDGLLDLYLSTYSPIEGGHGLAGGGGVLWPDIFLTPEVAEEFRQRSRSGASYVDVYGPPNYLLRNVGGRFEIADQNSTVGVWRKTLHSGWSDFDKDGDQDLYVCNDFAPDDFFVNDGHGNLERANESVGFSKPAFGMGVAWGDHNNDGFTDVYVSNMYSKAGKRITREFGGLNPDLVGMAAGNYLYEGSADGFRLASGPNGQHQEVAKAGWSWGGQFTDIDNDGFQDIHVAAGYYTAPAAIAQDIDL